MEDPFAGFEKFTLANGLEVNVLYMPGVAWQYVGFVVHVGATHDPKGLEGLAHFLEHIIPHSVSFPPVKIVDMLSDLGGWVNLGETSGFSTEYSFFSPRDEQIIRSLFDAYGEILLQAKIGRRLDTERKVIISEFNRRNQNKYVFEAMLRGHAIIHIGTWMGRMISPIGLPAALRAITCDDLQRHYNRFYIPANISIVCVGGFSPPDLELFLAGSLLAIEKPGEKTAILSKQVAIGIPRENRYVLRFKDYMILPNIKESGSYYSMVLVPGTIRWAVLHIAATMLERKFMRELRHRNGWAYDIHVNIVYLQNVSSLEISCSGFALEALDSIDDSIEQCIDSMLFSRKLFGRVKRHLVAERQLADMNGAQILEKAMGRVSTDRKIVTDTELTRDLVSVKFEEVCDIIPWIRRPQRYTVVVQP